MNATKTLTNIAIIILDRYHSLQIISADYQIFSECTVSYGDTWPTLQIMDKNGFLGTGFSECHFLKIWNGGKDNSYTDIRRDECCRLIAMLGVDCGVGLISVRCFDGCLWYSLFSFIFFSLWGYFIF